MVVRGEAWTEICQAFIWKSVHLSRLNIIKTYWNPIWNPLVSLCVLIHDTTIWRATTHIITHIYFSLLQITRNQALMSRAFLIRVGFGSGLTKKFGFWVRVRVLCIFSVSQHSSKTQTSYCSFQPSMVHWLSSSIFPCLFVCLSSRYGNIRPNLHFFQYIQA